MYGMDGAGHMGGMWLWWLIATAVVAAVAWGVVRSTSRNSRGSAESAEEVLKRRYATGEIDQQEFEKRLRDLRR